MADSSDAYKEFIDGLVKIADSVLAQRVRNGVWHREPPAEQDKYNNLLQTLSPQQRELIADIVQQAREGGIHDFLVYLTDQGFRLFKVDAALPSRPFGTESHYDFIARLAGDPWPDAG